MRDVRFDSRLEQAGLWADFHNLFMACLREHLTRALEPHYVAITEERVYVAWENPPRYYRPDAVIATGDPVPARSAPASGHVAVAEPVLRALPVPDEVRERFITLRTLDGRVVTIIELLSPNNKKPGHEGRGTYLKKRQELLANDVHLVEIDLLTGGERMPLAGEWPPGDYFVLVARSDRRPLAELYPFRTGEALPAIRFPLLAPDPDHILDLQSILSETWDRGSYDALLAHVRPGPDPSGQP